MPDTVQGLPFCLLLCADLKNERTLYCCPVPFQGELSDGRGRDPEQTCLRNQERERLPAVRPGGRYRSQRRLLHR